MNRLGVCVDVQAVTQLIRVEAEYFCTPLFAIFFDLVFEHEVQIIAYA